MRQSLRMRQRAPRRTGTAGSPHMRLAAPDGPSRRRDHGSVSHAGVDHHRMRCRRSPLPAKSVDQSPVQIFYLRHTWHMLEDSVGSEKVAFAICCRRLLVRNCGVKQSAPGWPPSNLGCVNKRSTAPSVGSLIRRGPSVLTLTPDGHEFEELFRQQPGSPGRDTWPRRSAGTGPTARCVLDSYVSVQIRVG